MSTAVSSTETPPRAVGWDRLPGGRDVADVGHLLAMRGGLLSGRRSRWAGPVVAGLTLGVAVAPAFAGQTYGEGRAFDALLVLPSAHAAFLGLALLAAVASGGGRELIARDEATPYPVSTTTDHLGALLLAPLNIAWILQAWLLLGTTAYAMGPGRLVAGQLVVVAWLVCATAVAQVLAWLLEAVRRRRAGVWVVRGLGVAVAAGAGTLQVTGRLTDTLDALPTDVLVIAATVSTDGWGLWWAVTAGLLVATAAAVVAGARAAAFAARRPPREEERSTSGVRTVRRAPRGDLRALLRVDRASVWRAVPMRRGLVVLAVMPGAVAVLGALQWDSAIILPGLVASGGALLFGVNAWCLDVRGALWRESLPIGPGLVFSARAIVLAEALLVASGLTILLSSLRAGLPDPVAATALLSAWSVVTLQAVSAAMTWSARSPYAVDLRSARATPAPPAVMIGYSTKLAVVTTLTGSIFAGLARAPDWRLPLLVAVPMLCWSGFRLARARRGWADPVERARVISTVAA